MVSAYSPLSASDAGHLRETLAALGAGDVAGAVAAIRQVSAAAGSHPQVLSVAARLLVAQGRLGDARATLEAVTAMAPDDAQAWNALGNVLSDMDEQPGAEAAYLRAVALAPEVADFWLNLGLVRIDLGDFAGARIAAEHATALAPRDARVAQLGGLAARGAGDVDAAVAAFALAHRIAPADAATRHNLADALRAVDRSDEALALLDPAQQFQPETRLLRAHLLADAARFGEAVAQYHAVAAEAPGLVDAHETLARLLPQLGQGDAALATYVPALAARPQDRALWLSAVASAKDLGTAEQLVAWSSAAIARFGRDPAFALAHAIGLAQQGQTSAAIDGLRTLAAEWPEEAGIRNHLAPLLLRCGEWRAAEAEALTTTRLAPLDQSGWAWLSVAWRLLGDAREDWLADYEALVMPVDLALSSAHLARLGDVLTGLHVTSHHPPNQSPRHGSQTRGNLFERRLPEIVALSDTIRTAIQARLATLAPDPTHPFRGRLANHIRFAGSWSIRLGSSGFHQNHIHHAGWLSSAMYISLPPEVAALPPEVTAPPPGTGALPPGALAFGQPDPALQLELPPRRVVHPVEGMLVLFPSYLWHGTIPFESTAPRLTVAFDALPWTLPG